MRSLATLAVTSGRKVSEHGKIKSRAKEVHSTIKNGKGVSLKASLWFRPAQTLERATGLSACASHSRPAPTKGRALSSKKITDLIELG